ncbi:FYN-binding protein 1 isoform X1 [Sorex fumeus]|uniref:FYN-binding protein 1 isoform X1 n=1 Tax=Sorex fumeus TaxID=62283 RepID=UPI0024AC90B5|nr:FYN-binding protein 1 isoform X1 [Sorex fumeus]
MAKFNTVATPTEDIPIVPIRPLKIPRQNSPSGAVAKKNLFSAQGEPCAPGGLSSAPKTVSPKPPLGVKPSEDKPDREAKPPLLKPTGVGQRFAAQANTATRDAEAKPGFPKSTPKPIHLPKEDYKPGFPPPPGNKPSFPGSSQNHDLPPPGPKPRSNTFAQENEQRAGFPKASGVKSRFMSASQEQDAKPLFPKPVFPRASVNPEHSHEEETPTKKGFPSPAAAKLKAGPGKSAQDELGNKDHGGEVASPHFPGVVLRPAGSRGLPKNAEEKKEEGKVDAAKNIFLNKINQEESASGTPPTKFPKTPSKLVIGGPWAQGQEKDKGDKSPGTPKQKPLPALFTLGPPPPKPNRPPHVDLTRFLKAASANSTGKAQASDSTAPAPPPPATHPSSQPPLPASHPAQSSVPSLPPRNMKPPLDLKSPVNEENQDAVMHSDGAGNIDEEESEGETYEDIEATKEREKKREKEEKKRLELEKKEQKEREKKEQEIRKKFKLTGPIQVIHHAKACCDVKGGKNELSFKQGEQIEIIRITDNPEGKWLGRTARGSYGYIKTTAVEIDYDSLKRKKTSFGALSPRPAEDDQELYDDVVEQDTTNSHSHSGSGGIFPPPPDDDIYDGIEEEEANDGAMQQAEEKSNTWSWGILKMLKGKDEKKKSIRVKPKESESDNNEGSSFPSPPKQLGDEVYDDVDATDFPAPPLEVSQEVKAKTQEKDLKKLRKQEKEEKEFRKKFKYDGEIRVLYSTRVASSFTSKKWGNRDLQVKPGEALEVIQSTDDTKVLCRNEDGKYGYVLRSYLVDNDGEIYDDIADGCIYDND